MVLCLLLERNFIEANKAEKTCHVVSFETAHNFVIFERRERKKRVNVSMKTGHLESHMIRVCVRFVRWPVCSRNKKVQQIYLSFLSLSVLIQLTFPRSPPCTRA